MGRRERTSATIEEKSPESATSVIFLCNPGALSNYLSSIYGAKCIITSSKALDQADLSAASALVILAELNWDSKLKSQFYGIDILRKLRAERRLIHPVVFCSFLPLSYFASNPKYEILKVPGHTFIQLPFRPKKDETIVNYIKRNLGAPLSEELLDDIVDHLCDAKGLIHEIHHHLKNAVVVPPGEQGDISRQRIVKAVDDAFQILSRMFPNDVRVAETRQRLFKDLGENVFVRNQYSRAIERVSQFAGDFERLAPAIADASPTMVEAPPWKILYIEDEAHLRERVQAEFVKRNLACVTAATAEEAFAILKNDAGTNLITLVITDYRLEQPDTFRKWQEMQGYSIIKEVYLNHPNLVSFFALTAASRRALLRVQKTYQVKVNTFSKEDVLSSDGAFNMFAEAVRREGDRVFDAVCSQPQLTSWITEDSKFAAPLKHYYRAHRLALDYETAEAEISAKAKAYVDGVVEVNETSSQPPGHKFQFQAGLAKGPDDPSMLPKFREKLIGRRIALGLFVLLEYYPESIYLAMRKSPFAQGNEIPSTLVDEAKQNLKPLLSTHLALSLVDDVPEHLLVEERAWLTEVLGVDLNEENRIAYTAIEAVAETFIEDLKEIGCGDVSALKQTMVRNLASAKDVLARLRKLAEDYRMTARFNELLKDVYLSATPGEKRAFRSSGILSLVGVYVGRNAQGVVDDFEHALGTED
jgi:CheY-like chemotaxis protein